MGSKVPISPIRAEDYVRRKHLLHEQVLRIKQLEKLLLAAWSALGPDTKHVELRKALKQALL